MARARNIKPGFFKNEDLAECSAWARLCFAGLWTLADREGRLEDRPKRIKGELFAFDSVEVEPLLVELQRFGFILRYEVETRCFIQIIAFHKHQNPHFKEPPSVIPSPESPGFYPHGKNEEPEALPPLNDGETLGKTEASPGLLGQQVDFHDGKTLLNPDSGFLIPDSLSPIPPASAAMRFEDFWKAWPKSDRKQDRAKCLDKWKREKLDRLVDIILADIRVKEQTDKWREGYIEAPLVYLNGKRWEDGVQASSAQPSSNDWTGSAL